jgi:alpha-glucosidase
LPVPPTATQVNVKTELRDPASTLNFYKKLISLRRTVPALRDGDQKMINFDEENVLAFVRKDAKTGDAVLVALNMTAENKTLKVDSSQLDLKAGTGKTLVPNTKTSIRLDNLALKPFEVLIARVQ